MKNTVKTVKKARATIKYMTVAEYVAWYKSQSYEKPIYQRESDKKAAREFFAHLLWLVNVFATGFEPALDPIHIRYNKKGELEIMDGQHRSEILAAILAKLVKIPATTTNEMQSDICIANVNKRFHELTDEEQEAIKNLKIPVCTHEVSDKEARAIFHALNSSKPLDTNDKTRNNYCDNNLYKAVTAQAEKEKVRKRNALPFKSEQAVGNFVYRCIRSDVGFEIPKSMNPSVLKQYSNLSREAAKNMVDSICKEARVANSLLKKELTDDQHILMGTYMFLKNMDGSTKTRAISIIKANHDKFNTVLNDKMVNSGVDFSHTAHDYGRSVLAAKLVSSAAKVVGV